MRNEIAKQVWESTRESGGATVDIDGIVPTAGFAVSPYPSRTWVMPIHCADTTVVDHWISTNLEWLGRENHYVGTWVADGLLHLDISIVIPVREHAIAIGRKRGQLAIWDLAKAEEITL